MSEIKNPPAFPVADVRTHDGFGIREGSDGMLLRDWFAGQVAGLLVIRALDSNFTAEQVSANAALLSYGMADALLAERARILPAKAPPANEGE